MIQELQQKDEKDLVLNEQPEKSSLVHSENRSFGVSKLLLRFRNLCIRKLKFKKYSLLVLGISPAKLNGENLVEGIATVLWIVSLSWSYLD